MLSTQARVQIRASRQQQEMSLLRTSGASSKLGAVEWQAERGAGWRGRTALAGPEVQRSRSTWIRREAHRRRVGRWRAGELEGPEYV